MARQNLTEAGAGTITASEAGKSPKLQVQLITPGWGSSGYYSAEVLEAGAKAGAWPAGTQMFLDHSTAEEREQRPERSVTDLAAKLTQTAYWNGSAVVAEAVPIGAGKQYVTDKEFLDAVGVSISTSAEVEVGEADGRKGWIVKEIFPDTFNSVDFVTHAGRGGKVLKLVESARRTVEQEIPEAFRRESAVTKIREARNVGQWIESRLHLELTQLADDMYGNGKLTREERIALSSAVGDALDAFTSNLEAGAAQLYTRDLWAEPEALVMAAEASRPAREASAEDTHRAVQDAVGNAYNDRDAETWTWLRDYDPDKKLAYFEVSIGGKTTTYQQAYTVAEDGGISLTGDRIEVTQHTTFVPVDPAGLSKSTQESQEDTMPMHEVEETRLRQLESDAGRVQLLETERDTARTELAETRKELAVEKAKSYAREFGVKFVNEANSELDPASVDRIVESAMRDIPLGDDDRLDTDTFSKQVDEARKVEETYLARLDKGAGRIQGVGPSTTNAPVVTESELDQRRRRVFGHSATKEA